MASENVVKQGKYVLGSKSAVGDPRRKWEDRVYVGEILRPEDEPLIVGIVADGVGSADNGARGAQLAIDTVIANIQKSQGSDILAIIEIAIVAANNAVFSENNRNMGDGLTTLVVCVIHRDRCYVGNVGDSRVYWVQAADPKKPGRALQLTRDHSYFNIYGGDQYSPEAGILVNAIGKKETVDVDFGFYLKGDDYDQAYKLGMTGLPLKAGDTILLCSDGLIKSSPLGEPYIKMSEIVEASQSEFEPDKAAIKMVSQAEGRRPDDNVSAVTIQYLSRELVNAIKARSKAAQTTRLLIRIAVVVVSVLAVLIIGTLSYKLMTAKPASTVYINITYTPFPSPTITPTVLPGLAMVQEVSGGSANLIQNQTITSGQQIDTRDAGVKIVVGQIGGNSAVMYWFKNNTTGTVDFDSSMLRPTIKSGSIYIQPAPGTTAEVHFANTDLVATVTGSRMIVGVNGKDITVYCFEGVCRMGKTIPVMHYLTFNVETSQWTPTNGAALMDYTQQWGWSNDCNSCLGDSVPSPTPPPPPTRPAQSQQTGATPETRRKNNSWFETIINIIPGGTPSH